MCVCTKSHELQIVFNTITTHCSYINIVILPFWGINVHTVMLLWSIIINNSI